MLLKESYIIKEGLYNRQWNIYKKGSIGTVIEETTRKDRKLKIKLDKDTTEKKYRLIKETDLQPYTFKNEKEVVCLNEKNCQSNSSNSDEDLSIEY